MVLDRDMALLPLLVVVCLLTLLWWLQVRHGVLAFAYHRVAWHLTSRNFGSVQRWVKGYVGEYCIEALRPGLPAVAGLW